VEVFSKDEKDAFLRHVFQRSILNIYPDEAKQYLYSKPGFVWSTVVLKDTWVAICKYDTQPFTDEQNTIIKRFANAFGQAYTRFLDLQKAEAQAREAQIQLSLERVRARAMAMHNTDELNEVLSVLFDQFDVLEIHPLTTSLALIDLEKNSFTFRMTGKEGKRSIGAHEFKLDAFEQWQEAAERWKNSEPDAINSFEFPKEILPRLWELFSEVFDEMPEDARPTMADVPNGLYITEGYFKFGYLGFSHKRKATEEEKTIVLRFAREFGAVYQRFLDLQKAEAQAREAQIEAGLERVRYSAMAMQSSEEVSAATAVVFHEISALGIETMRCGITVLHNDGTADVWVATASPQGNQMSGIGTIPLSLHPLWMGMYNAWNEKKDDFSYALKGDDLKNYYKIVAQLTTYSATYTANKELPAHDHYFYGSCFEQGALFTFSLHPHDEEKRKILRRFTSVFSFTFRRYLDLKHAEAQAREAQIQLGLERVRARTMAMHNSAEINAITGTLFNELIRLDFVLTRCLILIIDPQTRSSRWFMANPEEPLEPRDFFVPYHEYPGYLFLLKGWEERASKWIYENEGALKKDWDEFFFSETEMSSLPDSVKAGMRANKRAFVNASFGTFGGLVVGSLEALGDSQFEILMRFTKVFEQSYTRFLDLQKSEAQAREAQIEAALERVRSSSLAMHHSDQLREVVKVVFEKLKELDFAIDGAAFIATSIRHSRDMNVWIGDDHAEYPGCFRTPFYEAPIVTDIWNAYNSGLDFYSKSYSFEEKNAWFKFAFEHTDYQNLPEELKNWILGQESLTQCFALSKNSLIGIHFHHEKTLSEKEIGILKRFAKVFEQGYVRFLDLQKAEAQAREAEIELALERVRARTMSMQTSTELEDVMHTVFERLKELNVDFYTAIIIVFQEGSKDVLWWLENTEHQHFAKILIPYMDTPYLRDLANARETGSDFFTKQYPFEEKNDLFRHLFNNTDLKYVPEEQQKRFFEAPLATMSVGLAKYTAIHITSYSRKSFDDRENDIVKRFAKVFDHGYTRFLDLQTAEAQARESQIQLALERVRARTMAMQRSDELSETAYLLFQQFTQLGVSAIQITIGIMKEAQRVMEFRVTDWSGTGSKVNAGFEVSIDEPTVINKIYKAWKRKDTSIVIDLTSGELEAWLQYRNKVSGVEVKSTETAGRRVISVALFSKGMLAFSTALPPSPETVSILEKFAGVFDLTYTRFLDLQKAEASAREAQIEAALEKVRSSTMAMHKSEDLSKTAAVLFAQLAILGNTPDRISIGVLDEPAGVADMWLTDQSGNQIDLPYRVSLDEPTTIRKVFDGWKAGLKTILVDLTGQELKAWLKYVRQIGLTIKDEYFKNRRVHNVALFSHGWLNISSLEPLPADMMNVLERFAAVYSLTYRRFIDLQKAEAQARESQIQLALERVRARTMAMHKSEELAETALLLDQQLNELGVVPIRSMIAIVNEQEQIFDWWMTQPGGKQIEKQVSTQISGHPALGKMFACWKEQKGSMILNFPEKELSGWLNYVRTEMKLTVNEKLIEGRTTDTIIAPFKYGIVAFVVPAPNSQETVSLIERCAGVFDLTYGRFLDLQKAERQAREAQIEASLERLRSKTMAMHNSNDVGETVNTMFAEFVHLGITTNRCGILIFGDENIAEVWTARAMREGPAKLITGKLDVDAHKMLRYVYDAWKAKESFHQYDLADDDLKDYYHAINKEKYYPTKFDLNALPSKEFHSDFFFPDGAVFSFTNEPVPEEHKKIIKRFASVFGQTYRRYLDLRTAEAQAREAQIEASLERVRSKTMAMHTSQDVADTVAAYVR
jgi:hypothetical protein